MAQNEPYVFAVRTIVSTIFLDLWHRYHVQKPYTITVPHHCLKWMYIKTH